MTLLKGCDVSTYQPATLVDWTKQDFGIARACYGTVRDKSAVEHVRRIRAAGKLAGLYHFFRADQDVSQQADAFGLQLAACGGIEIAPALDVENYPGHEIGPADVDAMRAFLERFPAVTWMMYITQRDWHRLGKPAWMLNHPLWVAHYPARFSTSLLVNAATPNDAPWRIWQCRVGPLDQAIQDHKHPKAVDQNLAVDPLPRYGETPQPAPLTRPTLRLGDDDRKRGGDDVASMQRRLGVYADGKFGRLTLAALERFQAENHLIADGICGPMTWEMLEGISP